MTRSMTFLFVIENKMQEFKRRELYLIKLFIY